MSTAAPARHWTDDPEQLALLWDFLSATGRTPDDVAYFLRKPYRWQYAWDELQAAQAAGRDWDPA